MKSFPFGNPILPVQQSDRTPKRVFVLGVYASAVHARWLRADGSIAVRALAVSSEPEIFWRGDGEDEIIASIPLPEGAGRLVSPGEGLNGPSGQTLDQDFLRPMGLDRSSVWLCDLLPESRCNPNQANAIKREYDSMKTAYSLPDFDFPPLPKVLADENRVRAIETELEEAGSRILVTLGDLPLQWFASRHGAHSRLADYGSTNESYGRLHEIRIGDKQLLLLPLVHPRQAGQLGGYSETWWQLHQHWMTADAPAILINVPA